MNTDNLKLNQEQENEIRRAANNKHEARRTGTKLSPKTTPKGGLHGRFAKKGGIHARLATKKAAKGTRLGGRRAPKK